MLVRCVVLASLVLAACGGPQKGGPVPGDTHVSTPDGVGNTTSDPAPSTPSNGDAPAPAPPYVPPPEKPAAPVTFVFSNTAAAPLTFALDKGWGATLFAYTGKPPKAKTIVMFPKAGTAACDGSDGDICPAVVVVDDPRDAQKADKAETQRQLVDAKGEFELAWDGQVLAYEKAPKEARGRNKKCECYRKVAPEAGTYTVKACGLRTAEGAGNTTKIECVEGQMSLPVAEGDALRVALPFDGKAAK